MARLVFLLEERSMGVTLEALLPKVLPSAIDYVLVEHEGKKDLETSIPRKLRAWREPNVEFIVLRDQNSSDCRAVKRRLKTLCEEGRRSDTMVRVVCRELESWFLGDLEAVAQAYGRRRLAKLKSARKYRQPDDLTNASDEIRRLIPGYQKVSGARLIAPCLVLERNRSHSFQVFLRGVRALSGRLTGGSR
jgi:hypothetical protein